MIEVFVVIKDGTHQYYLLKVQRRGFDIYCFLPDLGVHHSLHKSGESHFRYEGKAAEHGEEPPVASLRGLGRASGICSAIFSIGSLSQDFRKFNKGARECFVIDKGLFSKDTRGVVVGVWAVPERNMVSFAFNNPNIPENLLYKVAQCEPQIWIYACPF